MLTDFFIARPDEIMHLTPEHIFAGTPVILAKQADPVKIARLENLLLGRSFDDTIQQLDANLALEFGEDGPWILAMDQELAAALAGLNNAAIPGYAAEWARSEEWELDNAAADELASLLRDLSVLAGHAVEEDSRLYVQMCL